MFIFLVMQSKTVQSVQITEKLHALQHIMSHLLDINKYCTWLYVTVKFFYSNVFVTQFKCLNKQKFTNQSAFASRAIENNNSNNLEHQNYTLLLACPSIFPGFDENQKK